MNTIFISRLNWSVAGKNLQCSFLGGLIFVVLVIFYPSYQHANPQLVKPSASNAIKPKPTSKPLPIPSTNSAVKPLSSVKSGVLDKNSIAVKKVSNVDDRLSKNGITYQKK